MRPAKNVKRLIKNLQDKTSAQMDEQVLGDVLRALEESKQPSALTWPNIRRTIMKSPITKLAVAAVVIAVVALGLFEFIGTDGTSGVVWAEVAKKVKASRGTIFRSAETSSDLPNKADYSIWYKSPRYSRKDSYKGGEITQSYYDNFDTMTSTSVYHTRKCYVTMTPFTTDEQAARRHQDWMDPKHFVQRILSCKHRELGQKTIEGVLCEGLETTDPAFFGPIPEPVSRLQVQLWVNAETEYPVLSDWKVTIDVNGEVVATEWIIDQFQWDVELDPSLFEPNIPPDYVLIGKL